MKKIIGIILSFTMLLSTAAMAAESEILVLLDGEILSFDVEPQIIDDRTMVPIRAIFEEMGAEVKWDDTTKSAICKKDNTTVSMTVGSKTEIINGKNVEMDIAPVVINDRTLAPARFVAEAFGYGVAWNGSLKAVTITNPNPGAAKTVEDMTPTLEKINLTISEGYYLKAKDMCQLIKETANVTEEVSEELDVLAEKAVYYYDYYEQEKQTEQTILGEWTCLTDDDPVLSHFARDVRFNEDGTFYFQTWRKKAEGTYTIVKNMIYLNGSSVYWDQQDPGYKPDGKYSTRFEVKEDCLVEYNDDTGEAYTYYRGWTN